MSSWEFGVMLGLGLLSSLHCSQMCGPIVIAYSVASAHSSPSRLSQVLGHLSYNAGRIITYTALGAIAGIAGQSMTWMGRLAGLSSMASILAGVLMILGGLAMFGWLPNASLLARSSAGFTSKFLAKLKGLLTVAGFGRRFLLGLALGFLPCGLIYAAMMKSLSAGSALGGAVGMLAFGIGTAASLLAIGVLSASFRFRLTRWGTQLSAAAVIVLGAFLLWRASMPMMMHTGAHCATH